MSKPTSNLKDKVVNRAVNSLRRNKRIEQISFAAIAKELGTTIDEISSFYTTTEDIFLEAQKKDWETLHRYWDKHIIHPLHSTQSFALLSRLDYHSCY